MKIGSIWGRISNPMTMTFDTQLFRETNLKRFEIYFEIYLKIFSLSKHLQNIFKCQPWD